MEWTEEKLRALSPQKLRDLYHNAEARADQEQAGHVLSLIEKLGLKILGESFKQSSPLGKKMRDIIFSDEGMHAALQAARDGLAPMAAIDPLLQKMLGGEYNRDVYEITIGAGTLVAELMRAHHWETNGRRMKLAENCIAKTAALFVHIPSKRP